MSNETLFTQIQALGMDIKMQKDQLAERYESISEGNRTARLESIKQARRRYYAAFDTLTPDEIREYGKFVKQMA